VKNSKSTPSVVHPRGEVVRQRVLDAAERLLDIGEREFSMRDLAAEAGVSFATPFNQFGNKAAIMYALSDRRISAMTARYASIDATGDAVRRVACAVECAAITMLEKPVINRVVMGWISTSNPASGEVLQRSKELWARAVGEGDGLRVELRERACRTLPQQLAFGFRGVLSFWTAGEVSDAALTQCALDIAETLMRGYVVDRATDEWRSVH
jgi:AcrR family transcriptional regulator